MGVKSAAKKTSSCQRVIVGSQNAVTKKVMSDSSVP